MTEYIYKVDGAPFADLRAANGQKAFYEKQGIMTKAIELDKGVGWCLEVIQRKRPGRTPLDQQNILTVEYHDPMYVPRFVKDRPGRLAKFEKAGWEVVKGDEKPGDNQVGNTTLPGGAITKPGRDGVPMVLMRKRRDWFEEDDQAKQDKITEDESRGLIAKAREENLTAATGYQMGIQVARTRTR